MTLRTYYLILLLALVAFMVAHCTPEIDRIETMVNSEIRAAILDCRGTAHIVEKDGKSIITCEPKPTKIED